MPPTRMVLITPYTHASHHLFHNTEPYKKLQNLQCNPSPVHSKSNIILNNSNCSSFMYITCKESEADLKLTDNLIFSPETWTVYGEQCYLNSSCPSMSSNHKSHSAVLQTNHTTHHKRTKNGVLSSAAA
jgi:hypothetical protein